MPKVGFRKAKPHSFSFQRGKLSLKFYVFQVSQTKADPGINEPILGGSHELSGVTSML